MILGPLLMCAGVFVAWAVFTGAFQAMFKPSGATP